MLLTQNYATTFTIRLPDTAFVSSFHSTFEAFLHHRAYGYMETFDVSSNLHEHVRTFEYESDVEQRA